MPSSGICRCVALVRNHVSEESIASIIRVERLGELRTTLAAIVSYTFLRNVGYCKSHTES
jgi:hypothetical protein